MEDFYDDEYDYFDSTIAELKEQLKKEVKQEIKDKMTALEKENAELQDVKENWEKIKKEYENKINETEREKQYILDNAKKEIYNATLKDLFENCEYFSKIYKVGTKYIEQDKCDKCNKDRKVTAIDCFGRKHEIPCKCAKSKCVYIAEENLGTEIYVQKDAQKDNFAFSIKEDSDYNYGCKLAKEDILEKFDKDKVKGRCNTYFTTLEEAQKYADYLNSKEEN